MKEGNITVTDEPAPSTPNLKILTIRGYFDTVTSKYVDEKVFPIIEGGKSNIILDLSSLEYLSSVGMLRLIKYSSTVIDKKRLLKFVKPTKHVYNSLKAAGVASRFDMYDSLEAAISSF